MHIFQNLNPPSQFLIAASSKKLSMCQHVVDHNSDVNFKCFEILISSKAKFGAIDFESLKEALRAGY